MRLNLSLTIAAVSLVSPVALCLAAEQGYCSQPALHDNPYLREKNELVATMLLPMFEQDPAMWQAIAYLNPSATSAGKPFSEYLADWHGACPTGTQEHVGKAMSLFGSAPSPAAPSWLARLGKKKPPVLQPEVFGVPPKPPGE